MHDSSIRYQQRRIKSLVRCLNQPVRGPPRMRFRRSAYTGADHTPALAGNTGEGIVARVVKQQQLSTFCVLGSIGDAFVVRPWA